MTYTVQLPAGGYTGWKFLERTAQTQRAIFENDSTIRRSRDYFLQNMPEVKEAEDLISNYRLLNVALQAYGLETDIGNKRFITKVLEADPEDKTSLVNRLSDKRYLHLCEAFAKFRSDEADQSALALKDMAVLFNTRSFERNIGSQYQEIELALNAQRELPELARREVSENTKWYQLLSSKPLRKVFEGAFGLSSNFGQLPIDRQVSEMRSKLEKLTGSSDLAQFEDGKQFDKLLNRYLLRSQIDVARVSSPFSVALQILRG
ncbi:DUF1217 domain-containing protein [Paracoccus ravus]|uniref:DUF1217 domain-containing protein n=1 Tax=Paracoccus ravus TaxID=2447760 RepID=UPI00106E7A6B|nr:DUF1217 domain-containing protein [Paracoccus ravus]